MKSILCFLFFAALFVAGTTSSLAQADAKAKAHQKVYQDKEKIRVQIQKDLSGLAAGKPLSFDGEVIFSEKVLPEFYKNRNYAPAWTDYAGLLDALDALEHSWEDGLKPADYHAAYIRKVVGQIKEKLGDNLVDYPAVARFDILVTDAVLLYAYHLLEGKVNPESLDPNWNYDFRDITASAPAKLQQAIDQHNVGETLHSMRPRFQLYQSYRDLLIRYTKLESEGGWKSIGGSKVIKPGEQDARIPQIRQRLAKTGELTVGSDMAALVYDEKLKADVQQFQKSNGLDADGIIGPGTIRVLDESAASRIDKLRVNMERARWIVANLSDDYIVVNIAAFKALYIENNKIRFATNVQVGKPYTSTPIFKDRLEYIEFNPTWTVPRSIIRSSVIPHLKKDPGYLEKNHFDLLDGSGKKLNPASIDFSKISSSNFPYTVRQQPGTWNALGVVKFIYPNKYSIFMHDTPSKALFERSERAFSHGCIRTQNPLALATILLEGTPYDKAKIDQVLQSGETTRAIPSKTIDVLTLYWTVGYDENHNLVFYKDIYGRDGKVLEHLNARKSAKRKAF